jgi:nitrite reductase (NO-forming)
MVAHHISNGMYGLILVEPEGGLPPVDREFYVMQGDIYTTGAFGEQGKQTTDITKMLDEDPEYIVFNGAVGALTPNHSRQIQRNAHLLHVGGPNFTSSFHVIGEISQSFTRQPHSAPHTDVQIHLVPPAARPWLNSA